MVLRDGRITQAGKYNDILNSGDFMDLVGAHKEALSAIDSISTSVQKQTDSSKNTNDSQNDEANDISGSKTQLVQEEEREKEE
ncbi:hypothetical protein L1987_26491 [Smallanthus sonchifolius]|uniref:Uncharacterized protein n=1 Tax=Smallanthus sonchifolius TaxID=185202 RepID=A0ACB9I916_9ASTR|nr:hypothetical protein L1987_26491 [Smallanthus sonchifolius]